MKLKQLSVFLENRPGALGETCRLLAHSNINILTFSLADTSEFGILRLIVPDWEKARQVLEGSGYPVKVTEVLALEVADRPGGLLEILDVIAQAGVNVEYTYAFTLRRRGRGLLVFRFDNLDAAIKALQAKKIRVLGPGQVFGQMAK